jgi:preprotein translocase subunit SecD
MRRALCILVIVALIASQVVAWPQEKAPTKKVPDGVYAVQRESLTEKEVLPLRDGEVLLVHRHRYLKKGDSEPPRFLVVRFSPDVDLDLAAEPKAIKDEAETVRILLKLQAKAATALERLTQDHVGRQVTIVVGGEVVTMHKVREVIKGGDVQITSCAAGAAEYLLDQLRAHHRNR